MQKLTVLGIRLVALFVLIQVLASLQVIPSLFLYNGSDFAGGILAVLAFIIYSILFCALFFGAEKIATFIMPPHEDKSIELDDYQKLSAVLFSTVGLFIIYWAFEMLLQSTVSVLNLNAMQPDSPFRTSRQILIPLFGGVIQLIAGISLFIGGKKLAKWWNDFRNWT
ncbi:MAG: hypothetical protein ABJR05_03640 [Balneola sp.]